MQKSASVDAAQSAAPYFLDRVSVTALDLPPLTTTLSSWLLKVSASPVVVPCTRSHIFGGAAEVPVRTYFPSSAV